MRVRSSEQTERHAFMKRYSLSVLVVLCTCLLGFALAGCQQLGVNAPKGVPTLKSPQVTATALGQADTLRVG